MGGRCVCPEAPPPPAPFTPGVLHSPHLTCRCCLSAVVDLTCVLERGASYEEIMGELQRASQEELKGILGCAAAAAVGWLLGAAAAVAAAGLCVPACSLRFCVNPVGSLVSVPHPPTMPPPVPPAAPLMCPCDPCFPPCLQLHLRRRRVDRLLRRHPLLHRRLHRRHPALAHLCQAGVLVRQR